jgi:hypothetical protein
VKGVIRLKKLIALILFTLFIFNTQVYGTTSKQKTDNNKNLKKSQSSGILYKNSEYGFSLIFPSYWKSKYYINISKVKKHTI